MDFISQDRHKKEGFDRGTICELFDDYGRFYLSESIRDEQKAIEFYERVLEKNAIFLDDSDENIIEHILKEESEHKMAFNKIYNKIDKFCSGL